MGQGSYTRSIGALAAIAMALSLATGAVAADRKSDQRKPGAAGAQTAARKGTAAVPRGTRPNPASRASSEAGKAPAALRAAAKPAAPPRKPVAKGLAPAAPDPGRRPTGPVSRQAGAQGTVIIGGTCTRLTVGTDKYPCKGAIYSLHPDGRVSVQFATPRSTVMLAGGGERETEVLEFGLNVDQVKVASNDRPTRLYSARGRCTVAMKDASGEVVRAISCNAKGGVLVEVEFRSDGEKVDAFYLLTDASAARGPSRD
ncbi:MAG TPA: hypothetical protein VHL98_06980 [Microvirga sp.]|jgi:hypothetical protein|nr:hypothetical protein [Microvirga sp.]